MTFNKCIASVFTAWLIEQFRQTKLIAKVPGFSALVFDEQEILLSPFLPEAVWPSPACVDGWTQTPPGGQKNDTQWQSCARNASLNTITSNRKPAKKI